MAAHVDSVGQAPLWEAVQLAIDAANHSKADSPEDVELKQRALAALGRTLSYRDIDPMTLPSSWRQQADNLVQYVNAVAGNLAQLEPTGGQSVRQARSQLASHIDQLWAAVNGWPQLPGRGIAKETAKAARDYIKAIDSIIEGQSNELLRVRNEFLLAETDFRAIVDEARSSLSSFTERSEGLRSDIEAWRAEQAPRFDSALDAAQQQVHDAVEQARRHAAAELDDVTDNYHANAERQLAEINVMAGSASDLVAAIAGESVSDGYIKYADREATSRKTWSVLAFGSGVIAVGLLILFMFISPPGDDGSTAMVILKSVITIAATLTAGYAATVARRHHVHETRARFRGLDMLALGAYSRDLEESDRRLLKLVIADRVFGTDGQDSGGRTSEFIRNAIKRAKADEAVSPAESPAVDRETA